MLIGYARVSKADGCRARPTGTCSLFRFSRQSANTPLYGGGHAAVDCVPFHIEGRRSLDDVLVRARSPRRDPGMNSVRIVTDTPDVNALS